MASIFPGTIVTSRDGALGVHLTYFEGKDRISGRDAIGFYFTALLNPRSDRTRLAVLFSGWTTRIRWEGFDLPDIPDDDERLVLFCEAAVGDFLDEQGLPPFTPSGASAAQITCFSERTASWTNLPRASDEEIDAYLEAKTYWAWKYELPSARFHHPDCLRLNSSLKSLQRIAIVGEGERWTGALSVEGGVMSLAPTPAFLRSKREPAQGRVGSASELLALLSPPRYAGPRGHWQKSISFSTADRRDPEHALKEAVCAVEGLCRLLTGQATATLGELIKDLRSSGRIDPALAKTLDGIWGYASNAPGVRHGAATRR